MCALVLLAGLALVYLWRLDAWLVNDDEGSYLYAAWRISLGELPYRDFLTPQLPAFLLPGGALMRFAGPSVWHLRALAALLTVGAGVWTWATARRLLGPAVGALSVPALLLHPMVFQECRTYRSEPFMLFFATLGVLLFSRVIESGDGADRRGLRSSRWWLVMAGLAFGLALLAKLFGALALSACVLWLLVDGWWQQRTRRAIAVDVIVLLASVALVVALGMGVFAVAGGPVVGEAVLGHHLRQGAGMAPLDVLRKGAVFCTEFLRYDNNGLLVFVALAGAWWAWRERRRGACLLAAQLPTALGFLVLTRQLFTRHFLYLLPALAVLWSWATWWLLARDREPSDAGRPLSATRRRVLGLGLVAALLVPWGINDWHRGWEWETGTQRIGDFIELVTRPDELVLADYSELNFYGRRPTTYAGASLSAGAARSGQITWSDPTAPHALREELAGQMPPLVLVDRATEYSQLHALRDWSAFEAWLAERYGAPAGFFTRHHQVFDVYAPGDRALPVMAVFLAGPTLLAAGLDRAEVSPGDVLAVRGAWRADIPIQGDMMVSLRLVDLDGRAWSAADEALRASGTTSLRVRPTSAWRPGELTADRTGLTVPLGTPPGDYEVRLALYRLTDQEPLAVADGWGHPLGRRVMVGTVRVAPRSSGLADIPAGTVVATPPAGDGEAGRAEGLRLLGRGALPPAPVEAGAVVEVELWWLADGPGRDLATRLRLERPEDGARAAAVITDSLGVPGTGSGAWPEVPLLVRQRLRLPIRADAAAGAYPLLVELVDGAEAVGAAVEIGRLSVTARNLSTLVTTPPPVGRLLDAHVQPLASLHGVDVPGEVAAAEAFEATLVWHVLTTPATGYQVTVQLVDATDAPLAQHDGPPGGGSRPTTTWLRGEYVVDAHRIELPPDLAPGRYRLVAGLYDPDTLRRLPVSGADAAGDLAVLGEVTVR